MRPIWLVFQNQDTLGADILQIFKNGDGENGVGRVWGGGGLEGGRREGERERVDGEREGRRERERVNGGWTDIG